jgi:tetratricopeptide (TPR) repeat protein
MSFLSRIFGSKNEPDEKRARLTQRLQRLEDEAANALPGYVGSSLNRAGDLALRAGDTDRAVAYYGRAIDAFLEDEQPEAARGVANKIIRVRPTAVRTLCTLTWLDLAARHSATALLHLRDYVMAAKDVDQYSLAASQIYDMARIFPDSEVLGAIADALDNLDFSHRADEVREWATAEGSPDAVTDRDALAVACLKAAVRSNERGTDAKKPTKKGGEGSPGTRRGGEAPSPRYRWD